MQFVIVWFNPRIFEIKVVKSEHNSTHQPFYAIIISRHIFTYNGYLSDKNKCTKDEIDN